MDCSARHRFCLIIAWLVVLTASVSTAWAARAVRVYEVNIRNADSSAALQDAMRQVLTRSTGRRDAGTDPALGTIVANAARYVQAYRPASGGVTQVVFDGAAIERDIVTAGRSVWPRERPFTLVVLNPPLTGSSAEAARRVLEEAAEARGLPISLVPMTVVDSTGNALGRDVLMQAAQRFGGDAVLVGRTDSPSANSQWQWTLHSNFTSDSSFIGPLDAGINSAVDALARTQEESFGAAETETVVQVSEVKSLVDYATVGRLLDSVPGVRKSTLEEADGTTATFRVLVRGGAETLGRALANSPRLERSAEADSSRLTYQLRP
jgi:Uncharacterized protein conserved in bacteria (DUF2066)